MRPSGRRDRRPASSHARALLVLGFASASLWFVLAITIPRVFGGRSPELAIAWWPNDAKAQARIAAATVRKKPSAEKIALAQASAETALRRSPLIVEASRTLALLAVEAKREERAARLLAYAESLSRRDVSTQLIFIQRTVDQKQIVEALHHFDRVLRTSYGGRRALIPVLVAASSDSTVVEPLATLIASRPPWWGSFMYSLAQGNGSPRALAVITDRLHLDAHKKAEAELLRIVLTRLVKYGEYASAQAIYQEAMRSRPASRSLVQNGDFQNDPLLPPFDWTMIDEPELAALRQVRQGTDHEFSLFLVAKNGRAGEVARQLLMLEPGGYRIAAVVGDVKGEADSRPTLSLTCAQGAKDPLVRLHGVDAPSSGVAIRQDFRIPPHGCPAQWLTLSIGSSFDGKASPWVDSIAVQTLGV